jgi:hypothetical protein
MRDLYSNINTLQAIAPAVQAATINGATIDTQNYTGAAFALNTGAIVGAGDFGASVEESDDGTTWAAAPVDHVQTDAPATLLAASTYRLGYVGWKRYIRLVLTKAGGTSLAAGAVAVLSPLNRPVA